MRRYSTISIPVEVKEILERAKGRTSWGDFLLKLYLDFKRLRGEMAFRRLVECLSDDDLEAIAYSHEEFRRRFLGN